MSPGWTPPAGVFGLIALMPDFEGRWDRQAGEDERS
jgi:hypothetical protein